MQRAIAEGRVGGGVLYTDEALTQVYKTGEVESYVKWNAGYRLPTEAEWEKAARGGLSGHRFPWSDVDTISHSRANYYSSSDYSYDISPTRGYHPTYMHQGIPGTSPVGSFAANGYGLYDMAGNVFEWCWDRYGASYYSRGSQTDPRGPASGSSRVFRGGGWNSRAIGCRSAHRGSGGPNWQNSPGYGGLRSVLSPGQPWGDSLIFTVDLTGNSATGIASQPVGGSRYAGQSITFTVTASGTGPFTYQWRKGGVNLIGATAASYTIASVSAGDAGNYDVVVTGACGSATSSDALMHIAITESDCLSSEAVAPVNLSKWTVEQFDFVDQGNAVWQISPDNSVAVQIFNADASILLSDFELADSRVQGTLRVDDLIDDDFIGFVFGYRDNQRFYLFD